jgi:hypothetical protein
MTDSLLEALLYFWVPTLDPRVLESKGLSQDQAGGRI